MAYVNGKFFRRNPHSLGDVRGGIEILNDAGIKYDAEQYAKTKKPKKNLSDFK
jgi:hypothetical protein